MSAQSYEVTLKPNDDDQYREIRQWELLFHALVEHVEGGLSDSASSMTVLNLKYQTGRSIDDALAESISGETFLFIVTCERALDAGFLFAALIGRPS